MNFHHGGTESTEEEISEELLFDFLRVLRVSLVKKAFGCGSSAL